MSGCVKPFKVKDGNKVNKLMPFPTDDESYQKSIKPFGQKLKA